MDAEIILLSYIALSSAILMGFVILLNFRITFLFRQQGVKYPEEWYEKVWRWVSGMLLVLMPIVAVLLLARLHEVKK